MLADGVRLLLLVVIPLAAAALTHELRGHPRLSAAAAMAALASVVAIAASMAGDTARGASIERDVGSALPGVGLTLRADSASLAAILAGSLAALLGTGRERRSEGVLLCVAGAAVVALAGTVVLAAAGIMVAGTGVLLLTPNPGPGRRAARLLGGAVMASGLSLLAAAAQLLAQTGSADATATASSSITDPIAVPWAVAGAALLIAPLLAGPGRRETPSWAAMAAVPAGFVVLLRLQQATAGALPPAASALLASAGTVTALAAAVAALRARSPRGALSAVAGVLTGWLLVLSGGDLASAAAPAAAALVAALELAWLAASVPAASAGATAVAALPGGLAVTALVLAGGSLVGRGAGAAPLLVLAGAATCGAIAAGRQLAALTLGTRPPLAAVPALLGGLAGGAVPGVAVTLAARALALDTSPAALDAGTVRVPGSAWSGGYVVLALGLGAVAAVSARVLLGDTSPASTPARDAGVARPNLRWALRARRATWPRARRLRSRLLAVDLWLVGQPGVALVAVVAGLALVTLR
ncbi:MAG: hypothetical protein ACYDAC_10315 [Candidatus Dormibacteria bacterium]